MDIGKRYIYLREVASGGHGQVNLYHDTALEREVAVKIILKGSNGEIPEGNEVRLISKVDSQHVVTIYDVFSIENNLIIVQEFLDGDDLSKLKGSLSIEAFLKLAFQISKGISDIHSVHVCHRDIKLNNMKEDSEGVVKIFDFGISKEGEVHNTLVGNATLLYAAPEIFDLHEKPNVTITTSYDIFSLGVCLWELLTGNLQCFNPRLNGYVGRADFSKYLTGCSQELINVLNATLDVAPSMRPSAQRLADLIRLEILKNKHIANFVHNSKKYRVDVKSPKSKVGVPAHYFDVHYDGYTFKIVNQFGDVFFNNIKRKTGESIPEACVITLGSGIDRIFVSYLSSNPEVII